MRRISWLAEQLLTFQEGLCFTELFPRAAKIFQSYKPLLRNQITRPFFMSDCHTIFLPAQVITFSPTGYCRTGVTGQGNFTTGIQSVTHLPNDSPPQISALAQTLQRQGSSVITVIRPRLYKGGAGTKDV